MGSSDSNDEAAADLEVTNTKMIPTINNADGGKIYAFEAFFDVDVKGGDNGGDGIPDKYQAFVEFRSANANHGTVASNLHQTVTFADDDANTRPPVLVTTALDGVVVNPANE